MKKIGLIGGLGPEATVDYYTAIINAFKKENKGSLNYPEIIIYSVNMDHFIGKIHRKEYRSAIDYLTQALQALERAGADFIAVTANTPHLFYYDLQKKVSVPMISIVEATAREAQRLGIKRAGLLGTGFTMDSDFYPEVFNRYRVEVVTPSGTDKEYINKKLFSEIELGVFKKETRQELEEIILRMQQEGKIDGIIMGCTELPLILTNKTYNDMLSLNTTQIHVDEIVAWSKKGV